MAEEWRMSESGTMTSPTSRSPRERAVRRSTWRQPEEAEEESGGMAKRSVAFQVGLRPP